LTLTFDRDITGLTANDITLNAGTTGATKGTLTSNGNGIYELTVSGITTTGEVTVEVSKSGYIINPASNTVQVYYVIPTVNFTNLTANGSTMETTTKLTLTFNRNITDLTADDITLSESYPSTGATKGTLTKLAGTGVYELTVSDITAGGEVTVTVSKNGYNFNPSSRSVTVLYKTHSNVGIGVGNPTVKLYLDGSATPLAEGGSTAIEQGRGIYIVSIPDGTYSDIVWYVNGSEVSRGESATSYTLPRRAAGTYLITVEATLTGGDMNTGNHNFVVR
jgi:hypothetical protein